MESAKPQIPRVVDILGEEQLQHMLKRFEGVFPYPLGIINIEGKMVVVSENLPALAPIPECVFCHTTEGIEVRLGDTTGPLTLAAPLSVQGELDGYLVVWDWKAVRDWQTFTPRLQTIAEIIEEKAYSEYELENLTEELVEKYNEINLIYDITEALGAVLDSKTVCNVIIDKAVRVIGVEKASVMLYDEQNDRLFIAAAHGLDLEEQMLQKISVAPGEGVSGKVFSTGKHLIIEDADETLLSELSHFTGHHESQPYPSTPDGINVNHSCRCR